MNSQGGGIWRTLQLLAGGSLLATIFCLLAETFWLFELFTHFRVQLLAILLVLFVVFAVMRKPLWAIALAAACIVNGTWVRDYVLPVGRTVADAALTSDTAEQRPATTTGTGESLPAELRILLSNVLASNPDAGALMSVVQAVEPDIVAVLELTPAFASDLESLHAQFPDRILQPQAGRFGLGVYSRVPVLEQTLLDLSGYVGIDARVELDGTQWHFVAVHLVPPVSGAMAQLRNTQLTVLAGHLDSLNAPYIVAGDFNLTPWSPYFSRFTEATGTRSALQGFGPGYTWPSYFPPLGIPIDHVLISDQFTVSDYFRATDIGSDHFPIVADINRR